MFEIKERLGRKKMALGVIHDRMRYPQRCYICASGAAELISEALEETKEKGWPKPKVSTIWKVLQDYRGEDLDRERMPLHQNSLRGHLYAHEPKWDQDFWK